jgi:hypothetical protein
MDRQMSELELELSVLNQGADSKILDVLRKTLPRSQNELGRISIRGVTQQGVPPKVSSKST